MSREKEPNVLESSFFFPSKFVAKHLYSSRTPYEDTEELYFIIISTIAVIKHFYNEKGIVLCKRDF